MFDSFRPWKSFNSLPSSAGATDYVDGHGLSRPRQRAGIACLECRMRKVRCDVFTKGNPCTNCQSNSRTCSIRKRSWKAHLEKQKSPASSARALSVPPAANPSASNPDVQLDIGDFECKITNMPGTLLKLHTQRFVNEVSFDASDLNGWNWVDSSSSNAIKRSSVQVNIAKNGLDLPASDLAHNTMRSLPEATQKFTELNSHTRFFSGSYHGPEVASSCYTFLNSGGLEHLPKEDMLFLIQRKCFSVPSRRLLQKLVTEYFKRVHPQLPILDEVDCMSMFDDTMRTSTKAGQMSLFVFHAVLHVASSFLSKSEARDLGFDCIRHARLAYYRRAKALFDLGVEKDSLPIAQGSLLLTFYTPIDDPKAHTYWLGVTIQHARVLHALDHRTYPGLAVDQAAQLKRLWWCCIIRDRSLSLGLRRPLQIPKAAVAVTPPYLEEQDFGAEIYSSKVYSPSTKKLLLRAFNWLCKLSVRLTDTLELLYPTWEAFPLGSHSMLPWDQRGIRLKIAENHLDGWFEGACSDQSLNLEGTSVADSLFVLRKLGFMYYHATKATIHSHVILESILNPVMTSATNDLRMQSNTQLEQAVHSMTMLLIDFLQAKVISHLPVAAVALAALPLAWHAVGSKLSPRYHEKKELQKRVSVYNKMMRTCQVMYEGTDRVIDTISELVSHIQLETIPGAANEISTTSQLLVASDGGQANMYNRDVSSGSTNTWAAMLLRYPQAYSRVIMGLDISLSLGQKLKYDDIPLLLQPSQSSILKFIPKSLSASPDAGGQSLYINLLGDESVVNSADNEFPPRVSTNAQSAHTVSAELVDLSHVSESAIIDPNNLNKNTPQLQDLGAGDKYAEMEVFEKLLQGYTEAACFLNSAGLFSGVV